MAVPGEKVIVAPLEAIPPIDESYLADALESVPLTRGDNVMVPYFGGTLISEIIGMTPPSMDTAAYRIRRHWWSREATNPLISEVFALYYQLITMLKVMFDIVNTMRSTRYEFIIKHIFNIDILVCTYG